MFPSGRINKFVMFEKMMPYKTYPFIISNTDRENDTETHWWSILNISPKSVLLLLDLFGISGKKRFIVGDDKKTVGKVLKGLKLAHKNDDKLTLIKLKFFMKGYKNLASIEVSNLFNTAKDFFHFVDSFNKSEKITNFVNVWMLEDPIQIEPTSTCGPLQIHFYKNLFFPDENSKIHYSTNFLRWTETITNS